MKRSIKNDSSLSQKNRKISAKHNYKNEKAQKDIALFTEEISHAKLRSL